MSHPDKEILDVYNDVGMVHDFTMFKESLVGVLPERTVVMGDSAYQGIKNYAQNAIIPYKGTKHYPLTDEQKEINTLISKARVKVEHVIRDVKIFRICKETYRGKGERGLHRVQIIASICNFMRSSYQKQA